MRLLDGDYYYTPISWAFQHVTKTLYMTLGPTFFSCNKMAITRRTRHLRKRKALIFEALVETHLSSYSKRDLKQFPKFWPRLRSLMIILMNMLMIMLMNMLMILLMNMLMNMFVLKYHEIIWQPLEFIQFDVWFHSHDFVQITFSSVVEILSDLHVLVKSCRRHYFHIPWGPESDCSSSFSCTTYVFSHVLVVVVF